MSWNRPSESVPPVKTAPNASRGILAGAVVVVIAILVAVVVFYGNGDEKKKPLVEKKAKQIVEVKPAVVDRPAPATNVTASAERPPVDPEYNSKEYPGEKLVSVTTNSGYIIEISQKPNGRRTRHVKEPPSMWKHGSDRLLAIALATSENQELPPWPPMGVEMDREFLESCKEPIEILPTDSADDAALKKLVMQAREEMKERIKNGEHFCDILDDFRKTFNENGKIRGQAMLEHYKIKQSGDAEAAREYAETINKAFEQMGIGSIDDKSKEEKENAHARPRGGKVK